MLPVVCLSSSYVHREAFIFYECYYEARNYLKSSSRGRCFVAQSTALPKNVRLSVYAVCTTYQHLYIFVVDRNSTSSLRWCPFASLISLHRHIDAFRASDHRPRMRARFISLGIAVLESVPFSCFSLVNRVQPHRVRMSFRGQCVIVLLCCDH